MVIPFGVPADSQGLGLGLAALVHAFMQVEGQHIALAQLASIARPVGSSDAAGGDDSVGAAGAATFAVESAEAAARRAAPVELFVPPAAWRELASRDHAPADVELVVTGAFDPPRTGGGALQLLAFDGRDGGVRARVDVFLDGELAGRHLLAALVELGAQVGSDATQLQDLGELGWDALESVLRAERCALHDPARGGPHDRLAAMAHLGRAIEEAPASPFAGRRLAAMAIDTAMTGGDPRLAEAALRALSRAADDAPAQTEILEATAALELRVGRAAEAEVHARSATVSRRARSYALLSEALRVQGFFGQARDALDAGAAIDPTDSLLETERGLLAATVGDLVSSAAAFRRVLAREPAHPSAFVHLAGQALASGDVSTSQQLVDHALSLSSPHPDVARRALQLVHATESDGLARSSRLARLSRALLLRVPEDLNGLLVLARALAHLGEARAAAAVFSRLETLAAGQPIGAEAARLRFGLEHPAPAEEMEALLRAAHVAEVSLLPTLAARARRFAQEHLDTSRPSDHRGAWVANVAAGVAARRQRRWADARDAFHAALDRQPGVAAAHVDLVEVHVELGEPELALEHAEALRHFGGDTPQTLCLVARAHHAAGRGAEAQAALDRALALDPAHAATRLLAAQVAATDTERTAPTSRPPQPSSSSPPSPPSSWRSLLDRLKRRP